MDVEWDLALRLLAGALCGFVVGLDRTRHLKGVGTRTLGLVGLASSAAVAAFAGVDPNAASRAVQGILAGVGFLGAGVILHPRRDGGPRGLTTAASVFVTAALGCAAGRGTWLIVVVGLTLAMAILLLGEKAERLFGGRDADRDGDTPPRP